MSKTFTSRPSVMSNRGRGRGQTETNRGRGRSTVTGQGPGATSRANTRPGVSQQFTGGQPSPSRVTRPLGSQQSVGDETKNSQTGQQSLSQRMSHQGAYTVVSPDEKRRQAIAEIAKKESDNYEAHKQRQRLTHVSYVGTVGGDTLEQESRQRAVDNQRTSKLNRLEKQQQYRNNKKQAEESVIEEKRRQQRQKADMNKMRDELTSAKQRARWDEDRKRKNDAFLSRFENKASTSGASYRKPPDDNLKNPQLLGQAPVSYKEFESQNRELSKNTTESSLGATGGTTGDIGSGNENQTNSDLQQLIKMFPQYESNILEDILQQTGTVENAAALLLN